MTAVILYRIDPAKRMHRYYRMEIILDLFGEWCLMREWGRVGTSGQMRSKSFHTPQKAEAALQRHRRVKERRGYTT
jgi:predicted DNA-binding WGR domain protein